VKHTLNLAKWNRRFKLIQSRISLIVVIMLVTTIICDTILLRTYDLFSKAASSIWTIPIFIIMVSVSIITQFSLLEDLRRKKAKIKYKIGAKFTQIHISISLVQLVLAINLIIAIVSIVAHSSYSTTVLIIGTTISYATSVILLLLLVIRFLRWFRSRRNIELLLYGISTTSIIVSAILTTLLSDLTVLNLPPVVRLKVGGTSIYIPPGSLQEILALANNLFVPISFSLTWFSTAILLRGYSARHGKLHYWILISIPLLVFMSQYLIQGFRLFEQLIITDPVFYGSLFTLLSIFTKLAGGILFGTAFWFISRKIYDGKTVRDYLVISSYGLLLLLLSIQILAIIIVPYPPFGILTISIAGLSSYLVFIGIYGSAVTMAENSKLRTEIRRTVTEFRFLDSIGSAQLEKKIEEEVVTVSKHFRDKLLQETGTQALDMDDRDVKDYVQEILREIKKK
jgi:hypothetical protein